MKFKIEILSTSLPSGVMLNVDRPDQNEIISNNEISISGWVLSDAEAPEIIIDCELLGTKNVFPINVERPDVVNYFGLPDTKIKCGFDFEFSLLNSNYKVSVKIGDIHIELVRVSQCPVAEDFLPLFQSWFRTIHNKPEMNDYLNLDSLSPKAIHDLLKFFFIFCSPNFLFLNLAQKKILPEESKSDFDSFIKSLRSEFWAVNTVIECSKSGELTVDFGCESSFFCTTSFWLENNNILVFYNGAEYFYLVQNLASVLLVWPSLFLAVPLHAQDMADIALESVCRYLSKFSSRVAEKESGLPSLSAVFGGINVSHNRPYHYIYDYLHGVEYLDRHKCKLNAISVKGYDFLNFHNIFNNIEKLDFVAYDFINKYVESNRLFYISPCLQYINGSDDRQLLELTRKIRSAYISNSNSSDCLVIWFGISTEKRGWLEAPHGIAKIINELAIEHSRIVVIVDGITSTFSNSVSSSQVFKENAEFNSLKSLVSKPNIEWISLIGATMDLKISTASDVDVFFSSYATDSMITSCICQKKGVVYAPTGIGSAKALHIHHNILELPKNHVLDIGDSSTPWHKLSVSMDWRHVYACIKQVIYGDG